MVELKEWINGSNIRTLIAGYSGSGDEGGIESIYGLAVDSQTTITLPTELYDQAEYLFDPQIEEHVGYEINEGGSGVIKFHFADGCIDSVEHDAGNYYEEDGDVTEYQLSHTELEYINELIKEQVEQKSSRSQGM